MNTSVESIVQESYKEFGFKPIKPNIMLGKSVALAQIIDHISGNIKN